MRFRIYLSSFMLGYILWVDGGRAETNQSHNVNSSRLLKQVRAGKTHSFLLADKQGNRKPTIGDMKEETRHAKIEHGNKITTRNHGKRKNTFNATTKLRHIFSAKRKSDIDIHERLGNVRSPVMYTSADGQDHYITLRNSQYPQGTPIDPNLPSKTFLVTVYGDQIEGAEEKLRNALTDPPLRKCPCKCSRTPCKNTEEECPCDDETQEPYSPHTGGYNLILYPNQGRSFGSHGCVCPCCLCSCLEPWHENYKCGCQNFPPVPCPCGDATNLAIQPQTSTPADSNSSPVPAPTSAVTTENQLASWTGTAPSCPCSCCECACEQPQMYPNYNCGCAHQSGASCPCDSQGWNNDQSTAENNVARSPSNSSYPLLPENSPYTAPVSTNNGPVVQTFRSGDYLFENSCDCYCCPCSCPGTENPSFDSSQCNCGLDTRAACTCRRSGVQKNN